MTGSRRRMADRLGSIAAVIVPRRYSDWLQAMCAEQAAVSDDDEALAWGWGALLCALGWRAREDGPYFAVLMFTLLAGQEWLSTAFIRPPRGAADMQGLGIGLGVVGWCLSWAAPSFVLAVMKPRRALLSALAVAFLEPSWATFLLAIPRSVGGGLRGMEGVLFFLLPTLVSSLVGAGAGAFAARAVRRR